MTKHGSDGQGYLNELFSNRVARYYDKLHEPEKVVPVDGSQAYGPIIQREIPYPYGHTFASFCLHRRVTHIGKVLVCTLGECTVAVETGGLGFVPLIFGFPELGSEVETRYATLAFLCSVEICKGVNDHTMMPEKVSDDVLRWRFTDHRYHAYNNHIEVCQEFQDIKVQEYLPTI